MNVNQMKLKNKPSIRQHIDLFPMNSKTFHDIIINFNFFLLAHCAVMQIEDTFPRDLKYEDTKKNNSDEEVK